MMCLFSASYQISFCPLGSSFWPCLMYCRFHPCEEIAAAAAAASVLPPQPGLPPPPPSPEQAATEGLARFQGGSDPAATSITSSPLGNYQACYETTAGLEFFWHEKHRHLRLCSLVFGIVFLCLFVTSGVGHVCISHVKRHFLHPSVQ